MTRRPPTFIFMLTRDDRTVAEARELIPQALAAGVRHIGFKDIGLPLSDLRDLAHMIRAGGATVYLEVVSLDVESEAASARAALTLDVDVLMGGTRPETVLPIITGSAIRYYPFPGAIVGHPSVLAGTIAEIADSARRLAELPGVDGLDLLAYRFAGDVSALMGLVISVAGDKPVIIAGSLDRDSRIRELALAGAAGFTVGTAALDGRFSSKPDLVSQLIAIQVAGGIDTSAATTPTTVVANHAI